MYIKNKKKFKLVKFILLKVSWLFQFISRFRKTEKRILLVKIDAIGDYILFRNFLEVLKTSEKYRNYEIELLGNRNWKDLAIEYDRHTVSKFHFINEDPLYEKPRDVFKLGWMLFKRRYEVVLQSTYSRSLMGNGLAALAAGRESVAYDSDNEHDAIYKPQTDKLYTRLIDLPKEITHEFERNRYFFQEIIETQELLIKGPELTVERHQSGNILIFAGSSYYKRNWEKEKFLEIIKRLLEETTSDIVLAGGPGEVPVASYLIGSLPPSIRLKDHTGSTSLPQLVQLIADSRLVISNETSAVHIAAACKTPVICITGGGHFNRFAPYPENITSKPSCAFSPMPCYYCNWQCKYHNGFNEPFPCLSRISVDRVWEEVEILIKSNP